MLRCAQHFVQQKHQFKFILGLSFWLKPTFRCLFRFTLLPTCSFSISIYHLLSDAIEQQMLCTIIKGLWHSHWNNQRAKVTLSDKHHTLRAERWPLPSERGFFSFTWKVKSNRSDIICSLSCWDRGQPQVRMPLRENKEFLVNHSARAELSLEFSDGWLCERDMFWVLVRPAYVRATFYPHTAVRVLSVSCPVSFWGINVHPEAWVHWSEFAGPNN